MATMSISGVVSGMDWESMIDEIITAAAKPAQVQVSKRTDLKNKKTLYEEMKVMVQSIQTSLTPLKLPSTYKAKDIDIERVDGAGSYKKVLTATVNADAQVNVYDILVKQIATAQTNRSNQITNSTIASTLSNAGITGPSTMYINAGGQRVGIDVYSTDSLQSLKSRINNTVNTLANPMNLTASVVDNRLVIKSNNTGLGITSTSETVRYNGGLSTLQNISYDGTGTLNVRNGSTAYTMGTDYTIVNGNEIRWNTYDRGDEVALGDSMNVSYTMAAGDVYTTTGTYGSSEATISGFDLTQNGTLASRTKIVDSSGNEYTYGKDFTIRSKKVVWSSAVNDDPEPSSYTVSFSKTDTQSASVSSTKSGTSTAPESFSVSYTKDLLSSVDITVNSGSYQSFDSLTYSGELSTMDGLTASPRAATTTSSFIVPDDASEFTLTDGTTEYVYGKDYVLRSPIITSTSNKAILSWYNAQDTNGNYFMNDYPGEQSINVNSKPSSGSLTLSYTHKYTSQNGISDEILNAAGSDLSGITITDSDSNVYTYGTDYTINTDGSINWMLQEPAQDDSFDITDLQAAYNGVYGSDIPTVTLTDSDGVLRTYLNPRDASMFNLEAGGQSYTYGKDYVIRVNDDGNGYALSWAVSSDKNGDGSVNLLDANTAVTTYTQYKGLSTYGTNAAPEAGSSYTFSFVKETTQEATKTVNSSTTNKTLKGILGFEVDEDDYSDVVVSNGKVTYRYGQDYKITDGAIEWINTNPTKPEAGKTYSINYESTGSSDLTMGNTTDDNYSVFSFLGQDTLPDDPENITVTDEDGTTYSYGTDFLIDSDGVLYWKADDQVSHPTGEYTLTYEAYTAPEYEDTYNSASTTQTIEIEVDYGEGKIDGNKLSYEQMLAGGALSSAFELTDSSGNTYTYGTDYTVTQGTDTDSSSGQHTALLNWINGPAADNTSFTLKYIANGEGGGEVLSTSIARSASDTINPDTSATYTHKYADWSRASEIRITDGKETYLMGSDFTISSDVNGDSVINWTDRDTTPDYTTAFSGAASITVTASDGTEITDFSITDDGSGNPVFAMDDGSTLDDDTYTVKVVKNGTTTLYNLESDGMSSMELKNRSLWESKDNSKAGSYKIYVTTSGATQVYDGTRPAGNYDFSIGTGLKYPSASDLNSGTTTITQGSKTFYEGTDYTIGTDDDGNAAINWNTSGSTWYYPNPGSMYNINYTASDGTTTTYTAMRKQRDVLNMRDVGMTTANGSISVQYGDGLGLTLDSSDTDEGNTIRATYSVDVDKTTLWTADGDATAFTFNWQTPTLTSRENMPSWGDEITVEYEYTQNTFTLSDDGSGVLDALGLNSEDNITEAHNAIIEVDGEEIQRDSNNIGEAYNNELIKGMTLTLKGTGEVSLDVFQDAEKAVEGINTFMENYNSLMQWINTRMTESEVDKDTAATIDSDDFRTRWGLLHGDALLRNTKSQMRSLLSQTFTYSFTQRDSNSEIYGTLGNNGLKNEATLRIRVAGTYMDLSLLPTHSLQDVVDMINDSTNLDMYNNFYDDTGKLREQPLVKASIQDDRLVLTSTGTDSITLSGTSAMNALKLNYTYRGLFQIGLATTSTDYGKSGELEFDESTFMEALEDNPDEVQEMMLMFANNMDSWVKSMLTTSSSGETKGTLSRRIDDLDTQIASIDEYLEKYQDRLDRQEEALRTKYAAAEQSIAKLSQQASSIASILNMLNNQGSSSSSSSSSSS